MSGFAQDIVTRIINVQWGGGAFIVKGHNSDVYYSADQKAEIWKYLGNFGSGGTHYNSGIAFAQVEVKGKKEDVFLMSTASTSTDGVDGSVILFSNDGASWTVVFSQYIATEGDILDPYLFEPTGIVWDEDEKAFFASFHAQIANIDDEGIHLTAGESVHKSTDGRTWTQISYDVSADPDFFTDDSASVMDGHFNKPANKDLVCDGLRGYRKDGNILISPTGLTGWGPVSGGTYDGPGGDVFGAHPASSVTIETAARRREVPVSMPCYAVGYSGGVWIAAGGFIQLGPIFSFKIDVSTDDGNTWTTAVDRSDIPFGTCIIAGQGGSV